MKPVAHPHPFISEDGHYCSHEYGTRGRCNRPPGNAVHDMSKAPIPEASYYETDDDNDLIDRGIRRCLESGKQQFSANDMQDLLSRVRDRKRPGKRFQEWADKGLIVRLDHPGVPSSNPKAKGHLVRVYGPGPNWGRRTA